MEDLGLSLSVSPTLSYRCLNGITKLVYITKKISSPVNYLLFYNNSGNSLDGYASIFYIHDCTLPIKNYGCRFLSLNQDHHNLSCVEQNFLIFSKEVFGIAFSRPFKFDSPISNAMLKSWDIKIPRKNSFSYINSDQISLLKNLK